MKGHSIRSWRVAPPLLLAAVGLCLCGCGVPGEPSPPSLRLPARVGNLSAARVADTVRLAWTMPARTTDGIVLKRPVQVEICRALGKGPCDILVKMSAQPGKPASYRDVLSGLLAHGRAGLLTYRVSLKNGNGRSAGSSNPVYSAAGDAPPAVTGLAAEVRQGSVLLRWNSATERRIVPRAASGKAGQARPVPKRSILIKRLLLVQPSPTGARQTPTKQKSSRNRALLAPAPPATVQMLAVPIKNYDPGHALDNSIEMNQHYRYVVERASSLTLDGHSVEIDGAPSDPITVDTTDIFPPPVPTGLAAVPDPAGGAVALSWTPDTVSDLAGYFLYRRELGSNLPSHAISPRDHPLTAPSFRDLNVEPGRRYAYSVSAVDQSGNESERSPEVIVEIPGR